MLRLLIVIVVLECTHSFRFSLGVRTGWLSRRTNLVSRINVATKAAHASVRVEPACPVFGICGGCQYQNLSYNHQLALKQEFVSASLKAFNLHSPPVQPVIPAIHELDYRNKAQFAIQRDAQGNTNVGLYGLNSNIAVDTKKCFIQHKAVNSVLQQFRLFLQRHKPSIYNETTHEGSLRHLVVRVGFERNETMVCVVSATRTFGHQASFVELMKQVPNMKSVLLHYNPLPGDQVIQDTRSIEPIKITKPVAKSGNVKPVAGAKTKTQNAQPKTIALSGRDYIIDTIAGVKVKISLNSFVQSNPRQTARLYEQVLRCVENSTNPANIESTNAAAPVATAQHTSHTNTPTNDTVHNSIHNTSNTTCNTRRVWDLYCGVGTIGMYLSKSPLVSKVIGVESSEDAVADARHNAKLNSIENIEFISGLVENIIRPPSCAGADTSTTTATTPIANKLTPHALPLSVPPAPPHIQPNDVVVLNPPRKGCHTSLLTTLQKSQVRTIVYISCNPKTLARDSQVLTGGVCKSDNKVDVKNGMYDIKSIQPVDMFPQTVHIETVVWLERVKLP